MLMCMLCAASTRPWGRFSTSSHAHPLNDAFTGLSHALVSTQATNYLSDLEGRYLSVAAVERCNQAPEDGELSLQFGQVGHGLALCLGGRTSMAPFHACRQ